MYVSIPIFIISVISSTESEGCELLQNWFHGNTEYKSRSPSRSALLKSFVSTYIFDDFDDRPEEGFCWALIKIWSEEPMDGSESMVYEYGGLVRRRSSVWELWSVLSGILVGKSINCVRLWVVAKAPHSNPAGFVLPEKDNQQLLWILKYQRKSSLSLGWRLSWRILSEMILKISELFGQLRDQYMTKMNFLWYGRDILKTENGK